MMKRVRALPFVLALLAGCVEPVGGTLVKKDYRPAVLVAYQAEGDFAPQLRYYLVQEKNGLAIFEQDEDGKGVLFERHWADPHGDHFAVWTVPGPAYEVLVPVDRTRPAYRFAYDGGRFAVENRDGIERPVPKLLVEASTKLVPAGAQLRKPKPAARVEPKRNDDFTH